MLMKSKIKLQAKMQHINEKQIKQRLRLNCYGFLQHFVA